MGFEKLIKIQTELKAPKSRRNSFGKYNYRSLEDIFEGVKPLLEKYKAAIVMNDEIVNIDGRFYVKASATFIDAEDSQTISNAAYAREAEMKKGMDESQITGSASSYARKYALNGLLLIDDTKDADTDEAQIESEARANKGEPKIDNIKVDIIRADIKEGRCKEEDLLKYYKIKSLDDMTEKQFRSYAAMKQKKDAQKKEDKKSE